MATTTIKLIRDQQSTLIEALTPTSLSGQLFREHERRDDFREWAEETPGAALRKFYIEDVGDYAPPLSSNSDDEELITTIEVLVAYPKDSRYGAGERRTMNDVMREDMHQIDTAIGHRGTANYVSGQNAAVAQNKETEEGELVDFLVLSYEVNFRRAM